MRAQTIFPDAPLTLTLCDRREAEKEEIEARRAMPEHLRFKDDMAHADATRNRSRGGQAFLSKYHHSGVFYSEDDRTKELMERERRNKVEMEDQVMDMASLPKMMQVRDFGKRSRSKHTHLRDVDTTKQDAGWAKGGGAGGGASTSGSVGNVCFHCEQPGHVRFSISTAETMRYITNDVLRSNGIALSFSDSSKKDLQSVTVTLNVDSETTVQKIGVGMTMYTLRHLEDGVEVHREVRRGESVRGQGVEIGMPTVTKEDVTTRKT